jgi:hypothetical protein
MGGSKRLGICIKRHRAPRTQRILADTLGRSPRWMAYVEAGKTDVGWCDLAAIATVLGRVQGRAFLNDAMALLYEEAEVDGVVKDALLGIHRRSFLGAGVAGAGVFSGMDLERIERSLQGLGADPTTPESMASLTRFYSSQSRVLGPGVVLPSLQAHLDNYLRVATAASPGISRSLKAGAAETALLCGVLSYRAGRISEAIQHWFLANGLAADSRHDVIQAYVLCVQAGLLHAPATQGGHGDGNPREARSMMDQALAIAGRNPEGITAATFYAWRASDHASLGNAKAAEQDLEAAGHALSVLALASHEDLTGLSTQTQLDLAIERAICALWLRQPDKVITELEAKDVADHPSSRGWKAARRSELAAAYGQKGETDHSVGLFHEAADLAIAAQEPWRLRWVGAVRQRWLPAGAVGEAVQELDRKLAPQ